MKFIRISDITSVSAAKIKSGTIDHMQSSWIEMSLSLGRSLIGEAYDSTKNYILYGCENTGAGLNYIISAGAIFTNGEIFQVAAKTFSVSGGQVAFFYGVEVPVTATNADPVTFTDASTHNIHIDRKGDWYGAATSGSALEFTNLVRMSSSQSLTLVNTWVHNTATYGTQTATAILDVDKVYFKGNFVTGASSLKNQTITTVDVEFRPTAKRYFKSTLDTLGGADQGLIMSVDTSGIVKVDSVESGAALGISGTVIHLNGCSYYK
jgi:hypothetical protein